MMVAGIVVLQALSTVSSKPSGSVKFTTLAGCAGSDDCTSSFTPLAKASH